MVLALLIFDSFLLSLYDVLVPFLKKDLNGLYQALVSRLFEQQKFSSWAISYYLLLCMKLGYSWRLKELETLVVQSKKMSLFPKYAHFFSLHYLANNSLEESKTWYLAVFQYKHLKEENTLHFDYAFKLLSLEQDDEVLQQLECLLSRKLDPYLALLTVYFAFTLLEKMDPESPEALHLWKHLPKQQSFIEKQKHYLKKIILNSNNYEVDIHSILLKNIAKQAMGWLESWTAQK